jgi:hypothetical protein
VITKVVRAAVKSAIKAERQRLVLAVREQLPHRSARLDVTPEQYAAFLRRLDEEQARAGRPPLRQASPWLH